jgi:hypothetical protein
MFCYEVGAYFIWQETNRIENGAPNISSIVVCIDCRVNKVTEPLHRNSKGCTSSDMEADGWDSCSSPLNWAQMSFACHELVGGLTSKRRFYSD